MSAERLYGSPKAFRRALTDKLKALANESKWELPQLQRQIAYDRLLERLYLVDEGWVVKGATALLARDLGVRGTIDIDLYRKLAVEEASRELREAAALDLGDWFTFELGVEQPVSDGASGLRAPVRASVGPTVWASFHVDLLGAELTMTGSPEQMPALARVGMPDVEQHGYRVYPLVDHVADKVAAIVSAASVGAEEQMAALVSEADRRGIKLPQRFTVPDRELWEPGYAAEARRSLLASAQTLEEALAIVVPFIDPLLAGRARGHWEPAQGSWLDSSE